MKHRTRGAQPPPPGPASTGTGPDTTPPLLQPPPTRSTAPHTDPDLGDPGVGAGPARHRSRRRGPGDGASHRPEPSAAPCTGPCTSPNRPRHRPPARPDIRRGRLRTDVALHRPRRQRPGRPRRGDPRACSPRLQRRAAATRRAPDLLLTPTRTILGTMPPVLAPTRTALDTVPLLDRTFDAVLSGPTWHCIDPATSGQGSRGAATREPARRVCNAEQPPPDAPQAYSSHRPGPSSAPCTGPRTDPNRPRHRAPVLAFALTIHGTATVPRPDRSRNRHRSSHRPGPSSERCRRASGWAAGGPRPGSQGGGTRPGSFRYPGAFEQAVRDSGLGWTILRSGGFDSNAYAWAASVRTQHTHVAPPGDAGLPINGPADIPEVTSAVCSPLPPSWSPGHPGHRAPQREPTRWSCCPPSRAGRLACDWRPPCSLRPTIQRCCSPTERPHWTITGSGAVSTAVPANLENAGQSGQGAIVSRETAARTGCPSSREGGRVSRETWAGLSPLFPAPRSIAPVLLKREAPRLVMPFGRLWLSWPSRAAPQTCLLSGCCSLAECRCNAAQTERVTPYRRPVFRSADPRDLTRTHRPGDPLPCSGR
ncbi:hypothetical protein SAMN05660976_06794 [Nonomuraea pusilla]|uniref:NAD(P)H-binding n=1 Tax=Nonomuraea pusilla TaxID=46177 RepID=A0A1H8DLZ4_9ACTN|nr:hypothetical protein SAMN05660976_06794 [Nonomuraea pusilla]